MLEYQPLNAEKNELRLLYFLQNDESLALSATHEYPDGIVQLEMRVVSLEDYTKESREAMASTGSMTYDIEDYFNRQVPALMKGQQDMDNAAFEKLAEDSMEEVMSSPTYGRWEWGDYFTLSYVWGVTTSSRKIIINGSEIEIMENLEDFLRGYIMEISPLSVLEKRTGFWIDALCINQHDVEERNSQVKRMGDIYKNASGTLSWLGKAANESDKAMDLLNWLSMQDFETNEEAAMGLAAVIDNNIFECGSWKALEQLFSRPYWNRLWIIQEIALSGNSLNFKCGTRQINWPLLHRAVNVLSLDIGRVRRAMRQGYEEPSVKKSSKFTFPLILHRIQQFGVFRAVEAEGLARSDLRHVLAIAQVAEQKDPRDKVYGILSLIDPKVSGSIMPDYAKSVSEIFTEFTKSVIRSTKRLDIIARWGELRTKQKTLPSWVSNLTGEPIVSLELTNKVPYSASKDSEAIFSFQDDELIARGFIIDNVDGLGTGFNDYIGEFFDSKIVQPLCYTHPYQDDDGKRNALWRTLTANRDERGEIAPESFKSLLEIPWNDMEEVNQFDDLFLQYFGFLRLFNEELLLGGQELKSFFPPSDHVFKTTPLLSIQQESIRRIRVLCGRRLIVTGKGYFGLAAMPAQKGDVICILLGCTSPIILRPSIDKLSYEVVGESYVHGVMNGEAMEWLEAGQFSLQDFTIK